MTTNSTVPFVWGETIERREHGVPFLSYSPRRRRIVELLDDAARWYARTYMVQGGRRVAFGELFERSASAANVLAAQGVQSGDTVMLLGSNSIEWVFGFWAAARIGAVVTLGNSWWSPTEVAHAVHVLHPAAVLADEKRLGVLADDVPSLDLGALSKLRAEAEGAPDESAARGGGEDDPAVIIFTAGTTGFPKPVALAHRSVLANLHNLLAISGRLPQNVTADRAQAVTLQSGPLFHMGGLQTLLLTLVGGSRLVFLSQGRFNPSEVLDLIEAERVTVWGAIPTMAARVLDDPTVKGRDLTSVRSISSGGQSVQPRLLERLREVFPNARRGLSTIYGMTETGGTVASASGAVMALHPTTSGRPLPTAEIRVAEPDFSGTGEILVRTPGQLLGYWDQTAADLVDEEGFVHTGDLGRIDNGMLYVTGRIKDLIIRGGENIAPAHVEAALLTHPEVVSAAVIGRPDDDLGERVAAVVQLGPGSELSPSLLSEHLTPILARFEIPVEWWIRREPLPMTDAGKTDKRSLAASWPAGEAKE